MYFIRSGISKTGHLVTRFLLMCVLVITLNEVAVAETGVVNYQAQLQRVQTLIRANVLNLARTILETEAPPSLPNQQWLQWERQLWVLYQAQRDWQALYARTQQVPPSFPDDIQLEAESWAIVALLASNQGAHARQLIRKHLVSTILGERKKKQLRERVVESYSNQSAFRDANIAMENYQHDYRSQEEEWLLLLL